MQTPCGDRLTMQLKIKVGLKVGLSRGSKAFGDNTTLGNAPLGLGPHTKSAIIMLGLGLGLRIAYKKVSPNPNGAYPSVVHIRV